MARDKRKSRRRKATGGEGVDWKSLAESEVGQQAIKLLKENAVPVTLAALTFAVDKFKNFRTKRAQKKEEMEEEVVEDLKHHGEGGKRKTRRLGRKSRRLGRKSRRRGRKSHKRKGGGREGETLREEVAAQHGSGCGPGEALCKGGRRKSHKRN